MSAITTRSERRHRRHVVTTATAIVILTACPLFGHHVGPAFEALEKRDEIFGICLVALRELLGPIHELFHVLIVAGVVFAVVDRLLARREVPRLLAGLDSSALDMRGALYGAVRAAGLAPTDVHVVTGLPVPAFTVGWVHPQVFVAREIESHLDREQLAAVLEHEAAHVRRRDPLRLSLLRILAGTFFYVPAIRSLTADMADEIEIAADDAVVGARPRRALVLASAIVTLAAWPEPAPLPAAVPGFLRKELFERRVRRLVGEKVIIRSHVTRPCLACATAVLTALWVSGLIMAHPLPAQTARATETTTAYCWQTLSSPWTHLLCHHMHHAGGSRPCPPQHHAA